MKLTAFQVQMYRGVIDSGRIDICPLTAIVGKNESGKTTLLRALHKFNPFQPDPYSMERDWPRGRRRERDPDTTVCTTWFRLDSDEQAKLAEILGSPWQEEEIKLWRNYKGDLEIDIPTNEATQRLHSNDVDQLFANIKAPTSPASEEFTEAFKREILVLRQLVHNGDITALEKELTSGTWMARVADTHSKSDNIRVHENQALVAARNTLAGVSNAAKTVPTVRRHLHEAIAAWLPTFVYMDDYRTFVGTAILDQFVARLRQNKLGEEDKTILTILRLSGLDPETLVQQASASDREARMLDLDDASATLTQTIEDRFRQRKYEVQFRIDGQQFFTFVKDSVDPSLIALEERSKGFQWFFSFDLMLMHESQGTFKDCVILLDEPGLHLHPSAQKDLLKRLEEYARENTLLYTTHLPFMLDLRAPERIRVITEGREGVRVSDTLTDATHEGKLVLQSALGMQGAQSYLVAKRNLVVEGVTDYWLLTELDSLMGRSGEQRIPSDVLITPAGGASEAAYIATFMVGQGLHVYVLVDGDSAGEQAKHQLARKWLDRYKGACARVQTLRDIFPEQASKGAAIEDIFDESLFLECLRSAYVEELPEPENLALTGKGPHAKRAERALKTLGLKLAKSKVAAAIRARLGETQSLTDLSPETQERVRCLFSGILSFFAPSADT